MDASRVTGALLALNKHHFGGTTGMIVGAIVLVFGVVRIVQRAAGALLFAAVGIAAIVVGLLLYARVL